MNATNSSSTPHASSASITTSARIRTSSRIDHAKKCVIDETELTSDADYVVTFTDRARDRNRAADHEPFPLIESRSIQ